MTSQANVSNHSQSATLLTAGVQNMTALVLGAVILFAVGFMPMEAAHNAAHDTRHALAFPCH